jgi:hypothetical protein
MTQTSTPQAGPEVLGYAVGREISYPGDTPEGCDKPGLYVGWQAATTRAEAEREISRVQAHHDAEVQFGRPDRDADTAEVLVVVELRRATAP